MIKTVHFVIIILLGLIIYLIWRLGNMVEHCSSCSSVSNSDVSSSGNLLGATDPEFPLHGLLGAKCGPGHPPCPVPGSRCYVTNPQTGEGGCLSPGIKCGPGHPPCPASSSRCYVSNPRTGEGYCSK